MGGVSVSSQITYCQNSALQSINSKKENLISTKQFYTLLLQKFLQNYILLYISAYIIAEILVYCINLLRTSNKILSQKLWFLIQIIKGEFFSDKKQAFIASTEDNYSC